MEKYIDNYSKIIPVIPSYLGFDFTINAHTEIYVHIREKLDLDLHCLQRVIQYE